MCRSLFQVYLFSDFSFLIHALELISVEMVRTWSRTQSRCLSPLSAREVLCEGALTLGSPSQFLQFEDSEDFHLDQLGIPEK